MSVLHYQMEVKFHLENRELHYLVRQDSGSARVPWIIKTVDRLKKLAVRKGAPPSSLWQLVIKRPHRPVRRRALYQSVDNLVFLSLVEFRSRSRDECADSRPGDQ